ncbi:hypothetical protein OXX59_004795 [Metschnikowia pulcherrima]
MILLGVLIWLPTVWAVRPFVFWDTPTEAYIGCKNYISSIASFSDTDKNIQWCSNDNAFISMVACLVESGLPSHVIQDVFELQCPGKPSGYSIINSAYKAYEDKAISPPSPGIVADFPVRLNIYEILEKKEESMRLHENKDYSMYLGIILNCYWLLVFVSAALVNWSVILMPRLRIYANGRFSKLVRGYFTLPALGKSHRMLSKKIFGFLHFYSPSRLESTIISIFVALSLILCSVGYTSARTPIAFHPAAKDYVRYVANRFAIISTTLVPMVFLLAGRNSILQWMTRWDHSTFLLYHRWIGRVVVFGIIVHSVMAAVSLYLHGKYTREISSWYVIWGIVATVSCTGILFSSLLYIRRHYYETFFVLHLVLAIIFLIGSWFHLANLGYSFLMTISITMLLVDRVLRYMRLFCFGFPRATITLYDDTLRVEVPCPKYYFSAAGGHAWLTFGRYFWQSHPFSCIESTQLNSLVFMCAIKNGVTKRIAHNVRCTAGDSITMRVAVEGIYGGPAPARFHKSKVFIAGGNGFPGIFSEAYSQARNASSSNENQILKFIWITKTIESLDICDEELQAMASTNIECTVYLTRCHLKSISPETEGDSRDLDNMEGHPDDKRGLLLQKYPHITFFYFRPELADIVAAETESCLDSIAFVSSGHPAMVDNMRAAVVKILPQTTKRVDFYDQLQGWA